MNLLRIQGLEQAYENGAGVSSELEEFLEAAAFEQDGSLLLTKDLYRAFFNSISEEIDNPANEVTQNNAFQKILSEIFRQNKSFALATMRGVQSCEAIWDKYCGSGNLADLKEAYESDMENYIMKSFSNAASPIFAVYASAEYTLETDGKFDRVFFINYLTTRITSERLRRALTYGMYSPSSPWNSTCREVLKWCEKQIEEQYGYECLKEIYELVKRDANYNRIIEFVDKWEGE